MPRLSSRVIDVEELVTFAAVPAPTGAEDQRLAWLERRLAVPGAGGIATPSAT